MKRELDRQMEEKKQRELREKEEINDYVNV